MTAPPLKESYAVQRKTAPWCTGGRLQLTPDGATLFTMCADVVNAVDLATAQLRDSFSGDNEPVMCMQLTPDGQTLAIASRSLMLRLWDWQEHRLVRAFKAHTGPVASMDFDSTSTLLATGAADATVKVWDIRQGYCTHNFRGSTGVVSMVQFGPGTGDDLTLFSCADDNTLREWSLRTSKPLRQYKGHMALVRQLAFFQNQIVSASRDKVLLVWDRATGQIVRTLTAFEVLEGVVNHPDTKKTKTKAAWHVVSVGHKGVLRKWNVVTGECVQEQTPPATAEPLALRQIFYSAGAKAFMTLTYDQQLQLHSPATLEPTRQVIAHFDEILDAKFVGPEQEHVALATNAAEIRVLKAATLETTTLYGHTNMVLCLDVSGDGRFLASCGKDMTARLWMVDETEDGAATKSTSSPAGLLMSCVAECVGHAQTVSAVALSRRTNAFVVTASEDTTVKLWQLAPLENATSFPVKLRARFTIRAHEKDISSLAVAPNDKLFATGSQDRTIKLWQASDGSELGVLRGHRRGVWSVQFSPTDQVLASASGDATVRVWSLADHSCIRTFEGHTNSVLKVCFVTRGMQLLSSGSDGLVKLWNLRTGENTCTMDGHEDKVWALAVRQGDGQDGLCVSGSADGTLVVWEDDTEKKQQERAAALAEEMALSQQLDNLVREKQLAAAFRLAIKLKKPRVMLKLVRGLAESNDMAAVEEALKELSKDHLSGVLNFIVEWNTNARFSDMGQLLLEAVLRSVAPVTLAAIPDARRLVEALTAYSERHYKRLDKLQQDTALLEYTWQAARAWAGGSTDSAPVSVPTKRPSAVSNGSTPKSKRGKKVGRRSDASDAQEAGSDREE